MTDSAETDGAQRAESEPSSPTAQVWSPTRSMISVLVGMVMNYFLMVLLQGLVARSFQLQATPENGSASISLPSSALTYIALGMFMNALIAGMTTARIAGIAPVRHGILLGAIFGFLVSGQLQTLRGYPGWFVVAMVLAPVLGSLCGGLWVSRTPRYRAAT